MFFHKTKILLIRYFTIKVSYTINYSKIDFKSDVLCLKKRQKAL